MFLYRSLSTALVCLLTCLAVIAQTLVFQGKVLRVDDGTTLVVLTQSKSEFRVKCLASIAPHESEDSSGQSKQQLSALVLGRTVTVEVKRKDQAGNILGRILLNGRDLCLDQIESGLASITEQLSELDSSTRERYSLAQGRARRLGTGIWTAKIESNNAAAATTLFAPKNESEPTKLGNSPTESTSSEFTNTKTSPSIGLSSSNSPSSSIVDVRGYFRKDGTWVAPHKRTAPDRNFDNNWSTQGNINPFTGKPGTKTRSWFSRNWGLVVTPLIGTGLYFSLRNLNIGGGSIPCNDGTISNARNRQGACSHHGGILFGH